MGYATRQEDDSNNYYIKASNAVAIVMIVVFGCLCSCGSLVTVPGIADGKGEVPLFVPPICTIVCTFSGSCAVFGCLRWAVDYMNVKEKKLASYTRFAQCSTAELTI